VKQHATVKIPSLKVVVPFKVADIPQHLVPAEGPPGEPVLVLALENSNLNIGARLSGKNYRKMLKTIAEHGADNVAVTLQGVLRDQGGTLLLTDAGFQVNVKNKPATSAAAQGKVDEATFFLAKLREAEAHPHLDEAERQFGWYLSAFLSAARSVLQVISGFEGSLKGSDKDDWTWAEQAKQDWATDDLELFRSLSDLRNLTVHQGRGGADSTIDTIEFVPEWGPPFRSRNPLGGYVFISQPPGEPPPRLGVKRFALKVGGRSLPALECVWKYLGLVNLMLDHYKVRTDNASLSPEGHSSATASPPSAPSEPR
jgi:hypothetical protein